MGKTPPKKDEAEGSPKKKAARVDDAARNASSPPRPTGMMKPKGDEAEESPRKGDEPNPTGKTPPKGDEAEGSPPKTSRSPRYTSPRQQDKRPLATVPESSELIVQGVGRASDKKQCKCNHVITDIAIEESSAIKKLSTSLKSKNALACFGCCDEDEKGKGIVKTRPEKSDLLICVKCCDHLCCGVGSIAYPYGHSRQHAQKKKHWFAVLYCDLQRGFCFKCNAEVSMPVKSVSRKLLAPPPLVGQTESEKVEMRGTVQAERHPSGTRSSDAQGYVIRGIRNLGNTCYMSAVLQCLFVLGELRERMLVDHPKGLIPEALKELVETSAAGDVLNPTQVLRVVRDFGKGASMKEDAFQVGSMEDSHEFLTLLLSLWKEGDDRQSNAPTVIDSIFWFEMLQILSCNKCGPCPSVHDFLELTLDFPPEWHQGNLEKMQTVPESGYFRDIGSEVIVEKTQPLQVDSTQAQHICQSKDVVQSTLQIKKGKSVDSLTEDSISIESLLSLLCKEKIGWSCSNCEKIVGSSTVRTFRFLTLPPVLTLHLNRTSHLTVGIKINGHVRFMEYLDVEQLMVPRSDKNRSRSTLYHLAGVVVHIGKGSLKQEGGHYVAYIRSSSCSSSWFLADDSQIRQVTLEEVLGTEAYILFYERMEGQDTSSERMQSLNKRMSEISKPSL